MQFVIVNKQHLHPINFHPEGILRALELHEIADIPVLIIKVNCICTKLGKIHKTVPLNCSS